jgi:hypothetical protein
VIAVSTSISFGAIAGLFVAVVMLSVLAIFCIVRDCTVCSLDKEFQENALARINHKIDEIMRTANDRTS